MAPKKDKKGKGKGKKGGTDGGMDELIDEMFYFPPEHEKQRREKAVKRIKEVCRRCRGSGAPCTRRRGNSGCREATRQVWHGAIGLFDYCAQSRSCTGRRVQLRRQYYQGAKVVDLIWDVFPHPRGSRLSDTQTPLNVLTVPCTCTGGWAFDPSHTCW